jgi:hypothetical protein
MLLLSRLCSANLSIIIIIIVPQRVLTEIYISATIKERSLPQVMPGCAASPKGDSLLDSLSVETVSSKMAQQLRCGEVEAPYCASNEILVICAQNKAFMGFVNCSEQHWAKVSASNMLSFFIIQMTFFCFRFCINSYLNATTGGISLKLKYTLLNRYIQILVDLELGL